MASRLLFLRRLSSVLKSPPSFSLVRRSCLPSLFCLNLSKPSKLSVEAHVSHVLESSRSFCSRPLDLNDGPAAIDYHSLLEEDEFHSLADCTINDLQEKLEEYGDCIQIDGFDLDYGNQVLTLKLGTLGTYVLNKQTPNRQLWLSSPMSGPSRFDWDRSAQAWVYRRNKANLLQLLQSELEQLCGVPITFT